MAVSIPTLRYPEKYNKDMPYVIFSSYNYQAPGVEELFQGADKSKKVYNNIPDIALYMPGDFSESINASWGLEPIYQGVGGDWAATAISNATNIFKGTLEGNKIISSAAAGAGNAPLPSDMLIFQSVDPMTINLNFKLVPYDQQEGNAIVKIANTFKKNIMPSLSNNGATKGLLLKFPPLWDITFVDINGVGISSESGRENSNGYEFMALVGCNISYVSEQESAAVYHDKNPVQINMSLTFQHIKKHWITG